MKNVRQLVDAFLGGERRHELPFRASWGDGNRNGQLRMVIPIAVEGELDVFELQLIKSPDGPSPGLRIVLRAGRAFWRLCMDDEEHVNKLKRPEDLPAMIRGPHFHAWGDNRMLGHPNSLPRRLGNARILPANIATDAAAFDWFLQQTNILPPSWEMPPWPVRTRLL